MIAVTQDRKRVHEHNPMHTKGFICLRPVAAAALFAALSGRSAVLAQTATPAQMPPVAGGADFGQPPSGQIPILFNDHTVYAKPDVLKRGRVLAALVRGRQIYVPLRSMFEQMGATVSASRDGRTVTAARDGTSVSVTVGKAEVILNGETRPLDVPPMLYHGIVLVPVRVLSEALGAYVLWVPERRVVVVRYIPAPQPSPSSPAAPPTVAPPLVPVPVPTPTAPPEEKSYRTFIQGAFTTPRNYNEFSAGQYCPESYLISAGYMFKHSPFAVKADFRQDAYVTSDNLTDSIGNHYTRFATIDGGIADVPVFLARQSTIDARLEYQVAAPRIYVGVAYLHASNSYGYAHLDAVGAGVEKLPDLRAGVNFFGSAFYYPSASGNYVVSEPSSSNVGRSYTQRYALIKYDVGLALVARRFPVYVYGGYTGDRCAAKANAPIGQTHDGPYVGLGVKL